MRIPPKQNFRKRSLIRFAFLLLLLLAPSPLLIPSATADDGPKKILIFSSEDLYVPAITLINQGLRSTMRKGSPVRLQFFYESQDSFRIASEKYEAELVALLRKKYEGENIDLVYVLGPPALRFLLKHHNEVFPDTPMVAILTDQRRLTDDTHGANITAVSGKVELSPTLDVALALQPSTQRVVVVAGKASFDTALVEQSRQEFKPYEGKLEFIYLIGLPMEELRSKLAQLPPKSIIFFFSYNSEGASKGLDNPEIIALLSPTSNAPIYGNSQAFIGMGIVGGRLIDFEAIGTAAALVGLRILSGESPANIPPQVVQNTTMVDWRELRRWGIPEKQVPAGSVVRFRQQTFWEQYKWRVVGVSSLCLIEAILIVLLLLNRRRRKQAQLEAQRFAELVEAQHRRLDEVVSNVPGVVWEARIDPVSGEQRTQFVSRYIEQLLGYSEEEFLSTRGFGYSLIPPGDRERVERETAEIFAGGTTGNIEFRWLTRRGQPLWVEAQLAVIRDEAGKAVGIRGVTMDITDRKKAEESLRAAHAEVSQLKNQLEAENVYLQEEIKLIHSDEIVGDSNAIKYVLFKIDQVGKTDTTVVILGETGTGKELVARAIHNRSTRSERPLVKVNCAALSASLIESELFGHEKGAFTGAAGRKIGRFELANGATIFLDEIGELPLELQPKLLRVIQEGEFERLGSSKTIKVDVRLIAASNRNLKEEVEKGTFREDLWYRLNVFPITVPPLRQRKEDIPQLVEHFVRGFSRKVGKIFTSVHPTSLKKLQDYAWPGNIRELSNIIERAVINSKGPVFQISEQFEQPKADKELDDIKTLQETEREYILRVLDHTGWRIEGTAGAARVLGLNPSTLRTRMNKLGIQKSLRTYAQNPTPN